MIVVTHKCNACQYSKDINYNMFMHVSLKFNMCMFMYRITSYFIRY